MTILKFRRLFKLSSYDTENFSKTVSSFDHLEVLRQDLYQYFAWLSSKSLKYLNIGDKSWKIFQDKIAQLTLKVQTKYQWYFIFTESWSGYEASFGILHLILTITFQSNNSSNFITPSFIWSIFCHLLLVLEFSFNHWWTTTFFVVECWSFQSNDTSKA